MEKYYEDNKIEIGLDEAGRGCLFGPSHGTRKRCYLV